MTVLDICRTSWQVSSVQTLGISCGTVSTPRSFIWLPSWPSLLRFRYRGVLILRERDVILPAQPLLFVLSLGIHSLALSVGCLGASRVPQIPRGALG